MTLDHHTLLPTRSTIIKHKLVPRAQLKVFVVACHGEGGRIEAQEAVKPDPPFRTRPSLVPRRSSLVVLHYAVGGVSLQSASGPDVRFVPDVSKGSHVS